MTAVASIEDVAECSGRADALVSWLLARTMRQRRAHRGGDGLHLGAVAGHPGERVGPGAGSRARQAVSRDCSAGANGGGRTCGRNCLGWHGRSCGTTPVMRSRRTRRSTRPLTCTKGSPPLRGTPARRCQAKVENCVTWGFVALVTVFGRAWADFDTYMPECWRMTRCAGRRRESRRGLAFATKPELAIAQAERLVTGGLRVGWAAADEVYGCSSDFRAALRARPGLRRHHLVRLQGHLRENQGHSPDQAVSEPCSNSARPTTARRGPATRSGRCSAQPTHRRAPGRPGRCPRDPGRRGRTAVSPADPQIYTGDAPIPVTGE